MLNKKISYDEAVNKLSIKAALLYTWCIPHLDVKGRIIGTPEYLKGIILPFMNEIKCDDIPLLLEEMMNNNLIILYGDGKYIEFNGFFKNQRIDEDRESISIIPDPTPDKLQSNSGETPQQVKLSKVKLSKYICFHPPNLDDVKEYCLERNNSVDPYKWFDFYEAKGWMIGKNKMKDWKAAVRTWETKQKGETYEHAL